MHRRTTSRRTLKGGKWSLKYKNSIDCSHPKGFSQKQHCTYGRNKKITQKIKNNKKKLLLY
jgi:hypothetical protein